LLIFPFCVLLLQYLANVDNKCEILPGFFMEDT
jgi:hypothetical protein